MSATTVHEQQTQDRQARLMMSVEQSHRRGNIEQTEDTLRTALKQRLQEVVKEQQKISLAADARRKRQEDVNRRRCSQHATRLREVREQEHKKRQFWEYFEGYKLNAILHQHSLERDNIKRLALRASAATRKRRKQTQPAAVDVTSLVASSLSDLPDVFGASGARRFAELSKALRSSSQGPAGGNASLFPLSVTNHEEPGVQSCTSDYYCLQKLYQTHPRRRLKRIAPPPPPPPPPLLLNAPTASQPQIYRKGNSLCALGTEGNGSAVTLLVDVCREVAVPNPQCILLGKCGCGLDPHTVAKEHRIACLHEEAARYNLQDSENLHWTVICEDMTRVSGTVHSTERIGGIITAFLTDMSQQVDFDLAAESALLQVCTHSIEHDTLTIPENCTDYYFPSETRPCLAVMDFLGSGGSRTAVAERVNREKNCLTLMSPAVSDVSYSSADLGKGRRGVVLYSRVCFALCAQPNRTLRILQFPFEGVVAGHRLGQIRGGRAYRRIAEYPAEELFLLAAVLNCMRKKVLIGVARQCFFRLQLAAAGRKSVPGTKQNRRRDTLRFEVAFRCRHHLRGLLRTYFGSLFLYSVEKSSRQHPRLKSRCFSTYGRGMDIMQITDSRDPHVRYGMSTDQENVAKKNSVMRQCRDWVQVRGKDGVENISDLRWPENTPIMKSADASAGEWRAQGFTLQAARQAELKRKEHMNTDALISMKNAQLAENERRQVDQMKLVAARHARRIKNEVTAEQEREKEAIYKVRMEKKEYRKMFGLRMHTEAILSQTKKKRDRACSQLRLRPLETKDVVQVSSV